MVARREAGIAAAERWSPLDHLRLRRREINGRIFFFLLAI